MQNDGLVNAFTIQVNGQDLEDEHAQQIKDIVVELNLHQPDACSITFFDPDLSLLDEPPIAIGAEVDVYLGRDETSAKVFNGEVTGHALDLPDHANGTLVVRAYDRSHRLQRGRYSRSFLNMTDGDIATKIAQENGLQPQCDSTDHVYDYVLQNNQTNWEFLQDRARRNGFELFVQDSTLNFRKPKMDDSPALSMEFWLEAIHSHMRVTSVGQVNEVTVRGWDIDAQQAIVGKATQGSATARGGDQKSGGAMAQPFGQASMLVSRVPSMTQAEADTLAQAIADDLAGAALDMELEINGSPGLRPGQVVDLGSLGDRYSGQYYLSSVVHRYHERRGFTTRLAIQGRRSGTLLEAVQGAANGAHGVGPAVMVGVVTNNKDDQGHGRVKVKLPWLSDDESDWARIVAPGAGSSTGMYWLPEVNDEVLVACEHGDPSRLYVLGGLWNPKLAPPKANSDAVDGEGKVTQRMIKSRSGHTITLDDTDGQGKIAIVDSSGNNTITIDTNSNKITLSAQGDLELNAQGTVKITGMTLDFAAQGEAKINASGNASLKGAALSVEAQATCDIKGAMINLN